jgi:hypothetical protein
MQKERKAFAEKQDLLALSLSLIISSLSLSLIVFVSLSFSHTHLHIRAFPPRSLSLKHTLILSLSSLKRSQTFIPLSNKHTRARTYTHTHAHTHTHALLLPLSLRQHCLKPPHALFNKDRAVSATSKRRQPQRYGGKFSTLG